MIDKTTKSLYYCKGENEDTSNRIETYDNLPLPQQEWLGTNEDAACSGAIRVTQGSNNLDATLKQSDVTQSRLIAATTPFKLNVKMTEPDERQLTLPK
mmetsp:Transcript_8132/g.11279  ORF Transcript_8132/g.11279 Transcript_8132/m.11279 type:complete len:98 (+) Transcript_8132:83-376(+)